MKLYMHPASTVSRPVRLLIAEKGLKVDEELVDIMTGAHHQEPYCSINPNRMVPMLQDGDLKLSESSAILKYLADKFDLPEYPKDLKQRARVNEAMDWFMANFYKDWGYNLIYPQLFPHHKRRSDEAHEGTIGWGVEKAAHWLKLLDTHWLGDGRKYLTGDQITIADYLASCVVAVGDIVRYDLSPYPNVKAWQGRMKALPNWAKISEVADGFAAAVKDKPFVTG